MLVEQGLSEAVGAFLHGPQVLNGTHDFEQVLLDVVCDVVRVGSRRDNEDIALVSLHLFFHFVVNVNGLVVVLDSKDTFINKVKLLQHVHEIKASTRVLRAGNNKIKLFLEFLDMLSIRIVWLKLVGPNRILLGDEAINFGR